MTTTFSVVKAAKKYSITQVLPGECFKYDGNYFAKLVKEDRWSKFHLAQFLSGISNHPSGKIVEFHGAETVEIVDCHIQLKER